MAESWVDILTSRRIGVIGGTGKLGSALARRWARAGLQVLIGSRDAAKAEQAAAVLAGEGMKVHAAANVTVAEQADIIVVTVPFASQAETLRQIAPACTGKLVIDTTVPLMPPKVMRAQLPAAGSAAVIARNILGEAVTVASAFHSVAAHRIASGGDPDCDVLIFSDDKDARATTVALAQAAGMRGIEAGSLVNSCAAEALTSVLIFINKHYGVADGAGIRITGIQQAKPPGQ